MLQAFGSWDKECLLLAPHSVPYMLGVGVAGWPLAVMQPAMLLSSPGYSRLSSFPKALRSFHLGLGNGTPSLSAVQVLSSSRGWSGMLQQPAPLCCI